MTKVLMGLMTLAALAGVFSLVALYMNHGTRIEDQAYYEIQKGKIDTIIENKESNGSN